MMQQILLGLGGEITNPPTSVNFAVLGGGGAGGGFDGYAAAGGAGSKPYQGTASPVAGTTYVVTVGAGQAGTAQAQNGQGGTSSFGSFGYSFGGQGGNYGQGNGGQNTTGGTNSGGGTSGYSGGSGVTLGSGGGAGAGGNGSTPGTFVVGVTAVLVFTCLFPLLNWESVVAVVEGDFFLQVVLVLHGAGGSIGKP